MLAPVFASSSVMSACSAQCGLATLVEAVANVTMGLLVAMTTQIVVSQSSGF